MLYFIELTRSLPAAVVSLNQGGGPISVQPLHDRHWPSLKDNNHHNTDGSEDDGEDDDDTDVDITMMMRMMVMTMILVMMVVAMMISW